MASLAAADLVNRSNAFFLLLYTFQGSNDALNTTQDSDVSGKSFVDRICEENIELFMRYFIS